MKICLLALQLFVVVFSLSPSARALPAELRGKLELQFQHYEKAQETLLKRIANEDLAPEDQRISRNEWEGILYLGTEQDWTTADLQVLRAHQQGRIIQARQAAKDSSVIDLQALREFPGKKSEEAIKAFCAEVPKGAMLHIHPSGTFDENTVRELLETRDPELPFAELLKYSNDPQYGTLLYPEEVEWLQQRPAVQRYSLLSAEEKERYREFFKLPPGSHPFERFDAVFNFVGTPIETWGDLEKAWMDFAKRAVAQKVLYVEFTTGVNAASLQNLAGLLQKIEGETGLIIRLNAAFVRTRTPAENSKQVEALLQITPNPWIVGIDFLANERQTPALEQGQQIYGRILKEVRAGRSGLHRTMHSGELGHPSNPRDAMILGAERLGHGVKLWEDPVALEYAIRENIAIEANLTSNLKLQVSASPEESHFLKFLRLGLPVSLSTDDEGIFDTDINQECELAVSGTDISYAEFREMAFNGIRTSFATGPVKLDLLEALESRFSRFERSQETPAQQVSGF